MFLTFHIFQRTSAVFPSLVKLPRHVEPSGSRQLTFALLHLRVSSGPPNVSSPKDPPPNPHSPAPAATSCRSLLLHAKHPTLFPGSFLWRIFQQVFKHPVAEKKFTPRNRTSWTVSWALGWDMMKVCHQEVAINNNTCRHWSKESHWIF